MDLTQIDLEVADGVLTVTLDRPDRLNAFTPTMARELRVAFDRADADDDVRVVVVTGRGRGFCSGADLASGGDTFDAGAQAGDAGAWEFDPERDRDLGGLVALRIFACTKLVIGAVNGPAVGVGATMTLPMDVRIASDCARFCFVFARRGIVPEACSSWFLPRVVGISRAMEWCGTGRVFDAAEALAGGLVRSVHPAGELLDAARELAAEVAAHTFGVSVALTRQMLWRMLGADHPLAAHEVDSRAIFALGRLPDAREGVESFLAKRPPAFPMRPSTDLPPEVWPFWEDRPFR
ncbi:enoyl-CoA hydratase-related protein [soil metagenome]